MSKSLLAFVATAISTRFRVPLPQIQYRFYCSSPSHPSSNKLFVGGPSLSLSLSYAHSFVFIDSEVLSGLSWSVDEKSLKDAFSSFGDVTEGNMRLNVFLGLCLLPMFLTRSYVFDVLSHWSVVATVGTYGCLEV